MIDTAGITGAALITAGAAWVYPPAGLIVAGTLMLSAAVIAARRQAPQPEDNE